MIEITMLEVSGRKAREASRVLSNAWAIGKRAERSRYPSVPTEHGTMTNVNAMAVEEFAYGMFLLFGGC